VQRTAQTESESSVTSPTWQGRNPPPLLDQITDLALKRARTALELDTAIEAARAEGHTLAEIAAAAGVTRQAVWKRLKG
jgi:AcrR family transcriptional regulator